MGMKQAAEIAIVFWSGAGHTRQLARMIARGAGRADLIDLEETPAPMARLAGARALVFGAPTYMGSLPAPFKAFMDATGEAWPGQPWQDRIAAGFTVAAHPAGDKLMALQQLALFAAQHGMIWVGQSSIGAPVLPEASPVNADGAWLGLSATEDGSPAAPIRPGDARTAQAFGARIARAVQRWRA